MATIDDISSFKFMSIEDWPETICLYQPPTDQMTLPEKSVCRSIQTFLIMNKKKIDYVERTNAEFMSPNNQIPFVIIEEQILAGWEEIVKKFNQKNQDESLGDAADLLFLNELYNLEQYITWCCDNNYEMIKKMYSKLYPFPLNHVLCLIKRRETKNKLKEKLEDIHDTEKAYEKIKEILEYFDFVLNSKKNNPSRSSNEFEALLYGHLYSLLNTELFSEELKDIVKSCENLIKFYDKIEDRYYNRSKTF